MSEGARARVCGPGRAGLDDGRETKWQGFANLVRSPESDISMAPLVSWGQARDYTSWVTSVHQELQMEEGSWEPSSILLRLRAHQWLWAELKAREELQQRATKMGQALLVAGTTAKVGIYPSSQATLSSLRLPPSRSQPLLLPSVSQRFLLGSISAPPPPHLPTFSSSGPGWASNPTGGT